VYVVEPIRIFQVDLQDIFLGCVTVHGIDVKFFGSLRKQKFSTWRGSNRA